jgi:hypothetical protein
MPPTTQTDVKLPGQDGNETGDRHNQDGRSQDDLGGAVALLEPGAGVEQTKVARDQLTEFVKFHDCFFGG